MAMPWMTEDNYESQSVDANSIRSALAALPECRTIRVDGARDVVSGEQRPFDGTIGYADWGSDKAPILLYFNAFGASYRDVLPLEYPLIRDGFRIIFLHRPGYGGTSIRRGWTDSRGTARLAACLLDETIGASDPPPLGVIGTSGGGPAALAFASLYPRRVRALVLQAPLARPLLFGHGERGGKVESFLPHFTRAAYAATIGCGRYSADSAFGALAFAARSAWRFLTLHPRDRAAIFAGYDWPELRKADPETFDLTFNIALGLPLPRENESRWSKIRDAASSTAMSLAKLRGIASDARNIHFARQAFCDWQAIEAPTLHAQDLGDAMVPITHADYVMGALTGVKMKETFRGRLSGHLVWFGPEADRYVAVRDAFLKRHLCGERRD
jgi:pimeloyl-ACP methyl ester carboxylesterase